jgi:DNA-binding IclR family transcriptional regulator
VARRAAPQSQQQSRPSAASATIFSVGVPARRASGKGIQAIRIGFDVLDCLAATRQPMPLGAIAQATGMAPSKLRFYLVSFIQLGLVSQDPLSGRYNLGPHAIKLGLAALEQFDIVTASQRVLHDLADKLGYSAFLAVWGNHGPTIVSRVDGRNKTVLEVRVGSVLPLLNSAIGRVYLSYLPRSTTAGLVKSEMASLKQSGSAAKATEKLIEATRAAGVAVARGTLLTGFTAIACPIMDHAGLPAAAMSVIGRIGSLDDSVAGTPARLLKSVTACLGQQIGWRADGAAASRPVSLQRGASKPRAA